MSLTSLASCAARPSRFRDAVLLIGAEALDHLQCDRDRHRRGGASRALPRIRACGAGERPSVAVQRTEADPRWSRHRSRSTVSGIVSPTSDKLGGSFRLVPCTVIDVITGAELLTGGGGGGGRVELDRAVRRIAARHRKEHSNERKAEEFVARYPRPDPTRSGGPSRPLGTSRITYTVGLSCDS